MRMFKFKSTLVALLLSGGIGMQAQNKLNASYETNAEVVVELQANHTNIIVEPWNRNEVKIEAYLDGAELTEEENRRILDSWNLDTRASQSQISIRSVGGSGAASPVRFPERRMLPIDMSERMDALMNHFAQHPDSVNSFGNLREMRFDFDAYTQDGAAYLEQWEQQVKERLGDNAQVEVHTWSSSSQDSVSQQAMQEHMAAVNQRLQEARAQFEDRYGMMMQQMSERFLGRMQQHRNQFFNGEAQGNPNSVVKRTIKLRMPANGRLVLRVRHGAVNLKGEFKDMHASVSYAPFTAGTLSGKNTLLQVSYAPVKIDVWNYGELQASYTPLCEIGTVRSLRLTSNSGDLKIGKILDTALVSGTFGKIEVAEVGKGFSLVDFSLNNSDLNLHLPNTALDFAYHGTRSAISYPNALKAERTESYDAEIINAHHKSANANASINIRAEYSKVDIQ